MTRTIDPIMYSNLAGSEGMNLFKTNKIIPIIINAIPVSNDTILFLYIQKGLYHLSNIKRKKFSYNLSLIYSRVSFSALSPKKVITRSNSDFLKYYSKII